MIDFLKKIFAAPEETSPGDGSEPRPRDVRLAACALFLEMAHIDEAFSGEEQAEILNILETEFSLSPEHAQQLTREAREELEESKDLWKFTNAINQHYELEEKIRVVELLWQVVYADGRLDRYENYLMHKLARLLNLKHSQLIDAKLKVLEARR